MIRPGTNLMITVFVLLCLELTRVPLGFLCRLALVGHRVAHHFHEESGIVGHFLEHHKHLLHFGRVGGRLIDELI